jgi:hypothetical protein
MPLQDGSIRTLDEFDALFIALHDVEAIARRIPGSGLWLAAPPARIPRTSPLRTARRRVCARVECSGNLQPPGVFVFTSAISGCDSPIRAL